MLVFLCSLHYGQVQDVSVCPGHWKVIFLVTLLHHSCCDLLNISHVSVFMQPTRWPNTECQCVPWAWRKSSVMRGLLSTHYGQGQVGNDNNNVLLYEVFLQIGTHSPLQSKEPKHSQKAQAYTHRHTHTTQHNPAQHNTHTQHNTTQPCTAPHTHTTQQKVQHNNNNTHTHNRITWRGEISKMIWKIWCHNVALYVANVCIETVLEGTLFKTIM